MRNNERLHPEPDPRAVTVAGALRDATGAGCVILFGSRARGDWTVGSDVDLMVVNPEPFTGEELSRMQSAAERIAEQTYHEYTGVDLVFMTTEEYDLKSLHTINNVAAHVRREGIAVSSDPENYSSGGSEEHGNDSSAEYTERERRMADANEHYAIMHDLLDLGRESNHAAYCAHQTLEHAMKALISAQGYEYPHHHGLTRLYETILVNDPGMDWQPQSNLPQLNNYAGGSRYGAALDPVRDFRQMANAATHDLERIYRRITELTGEDPWSVPSEGTTQVIVPRRR